MMANLLPLDKAVDQLQRASADYAAAIVALKDAQPARRRAKAIELRKAYEKVSAAHWEWNEVEQARSPST